MNENQTTEQIRNTLGATYTIAEVKGFLAKAEAESARQAPYFDGRLLDRIERLKLALQGPPSPTPVTIDDCDRLRAIVADFESCFELDDFNDIPHEGAVEAIGLISDFVERVSCDIAGRA